MEDIIILEGIKLTESAFVINENILLEKTNSDIDEFSCVMRVKDVDLKSDLNLDPFMFFNSLRLALPQVNIYSHRYLHNQSTILSELLLNWNTKLSNHYVRNNTGLRTSPSMFVIIDKDEIERIKSIHHLVVAYYKALNTLMEKKVTNWEYALNQYLNCCANNSLEDSILNIITGLETLLVKGDGQLTFKVALYSSIFLTDDFDKRQECYHLIKRMYNLRSKVVHGDIPSFVKMISKPNIYEDYYSLKKIFSSILVKSALFIEDEIEDKIIESLLRSPHIT